VKLQIETNGELEVDISVSNLKPRISTWLFSAWAHVKKMEAMIQKMVAKNWFERVFLSTFQLKTIEVNAKSPLFTMNP
jgi:hypothetical protein